MPADVAESLRAEGCCGARASMPETPSSGAWREEHNCTGGGGSRDRSLRRACFRPWRLAVRTSSRPRERKSKRAVPWDVLDRLIATRATDRLADTRDLAIVLLAFASGVRRRSEVARLRVEQLRDKPPARLDPRDGKLPTLPCLAIQLGETKTGDADGG
jgi:hypothetical protein